MFFSIASFVLIHICWLPQNSQRTNPASIAGHSSTVRMRYNAIQSLCTCEADPPVLHIELCIHLPEETPAQDPGVLREHDQLQQVHAFVSHLELKQSWRRQVAQRAMFSIALVLLQALHLLCMYLCISRSTHTSPRFLSN